MHRNILTVHVYTSVVGRKLPVHTVIHGVRACVCVCVCACTVVVHPKYLVHPFFICCSGFIWFYK